MKSRKLIVASLLAGASLTSYAKAPEATVKEYSLAVAAGQIAEAKTYLSRQALALIGDQNMAFIVASEAERIRKCGGFKSLDVKLEGVGEVRVGTLYVTYNGKCPEKSHITKVIKQDGEWKLSPGN